MERCVITILSFSAASDPWITQWAWRMRGLFLFSRSQNIREDPSGPFVTRICESEEKTSALIGVSNDGERVGRGAESWASSTPLVV